MQGDAPLAAHGSDGTKPWQRLARQWPVFRVPSHPFGAKAHRDGKAHEGLGAITEV
jgi:hypothetical protein